jgi:ABC-type transport system substrate-binding protein
VEEPDVERAADCTADDLSADDSAACDTWAPYDEAFENARTTLYGFVVEDEPTAGGFGFTNWEPGAFVQNNANEDFYFNGAEIVEYDDGTYVLNTADGRSMEIYGSSGGEETLRFLDGPYAPNVVFSIYSDQNAAFLALQSGEVDYVLNPLGLARGLRETATQSGGVNIYANQSNGMFYLAFNMRKEPMSDPAFRQAFDIIIDKEFVTGRILQGAVDPLYSVVPAGNVAWHNADVPTPYVGMSREERVDLAVEVLSDAGWTWTQDPAWSEDLQDVVPGEGMLMPNGSPMPELTILGPGPAYDPLRATFNQWISEWAREMGMSVESELTGFNVILDPVFVESNFDLYILGWGLTPFADHIVEFFHSRNDTATSGNYNTPGIIDAELDAVLEAFEKSTDVEAARALNFEAQVILADRRPYIPLFTNVTYDLARANINFPYTTVLDGLAGQNGLQTSSEILVSQ